MSGRLESNAMILMRRKFISRRGASAVEFALILPILVMITFGIIEFGAYMFNQQIITNASREGARAGIVASVPRLQASGGDCTITVPAQSIKCVVTNYAKAYMITFGAINDPILDPDPPTGYNASATFGQNLIVTVTYNYSFLILPYSKTMHATTVMRYE